MKTMKTTVSTIKNTHKMRRLWSMVIFFLSNLLLSFVLASASSASSSDMLIIRHGRSRVRHSTEKNHIRWGLKAFDNLTLDYDYDTNETTMDMVGNNQSSYFVTGSEIFYLNGTNSGSSSGSSSSSNSISSNSNISGLGGGGTSVEKIYSYSTSSSMILENSDILNPALMKLPSQSSPLGPPGQKKKIKKKQIMANIQKTVDKGLEYLKSHAHLNKENMEINSVKPILMDKLYVESTPASLTSPVIRNLNTNNKMELVNAQLQQQQQPQQKQTSSKSTFIESISPRKNTKKMLNIYSQRIPNDEYQMQNDDPLAYIDKTELVSSTQPSTLLISADLDTTSGYVDDQQNRDVDHNDNDKDNNNNNNNNNNNDDNDDDSDDDDDDNDGDLVELNNHANKFVKNDFYKINNDDNVDGTVSNSTKIITSTNSSTINENYNSNKNVYKMENKNLFIEPPPKRPFVRLNQNQNKKSTKLHSVTSAVMVNSKNNNNNNNKPTKLKYTNMLNFLKDENNSDDNNDSMIILQNPTQITTFNSDDYSSDSDSISKFGGGSVGGSIIVGGGSGGIKSQPYSDSLDIIDDNLDGGNDDNNSPYEIPMENLDLNIGNGNIDTNGLIILRLGDSFDNYDDLEGLDETSRKNRINLRNGADVLTRFLQIVESQHLLGANCTAGTALNLGEGVVDRYAHDRFRVTAEVAVNRANMLTRIFKLSAPEVLMSETLLHASVLSMIEFNDDIFAAGNCFDYNQHPKKQGLYCPFAYRLPWPQLGSSLAKDLAVEYDYLGNSSEWFFQARKNAEKVISKNEQYITAYHRYINQNQSEDTILSVKYEDGKWSKPYYDCGGGNIWMLTYTVPFFGYDNGTYFFKGTSGIDIDLRRVDIDQCAQRHIPGNTQPLNIFAGTDKCKHRTTECIAITGLGFRRGSYKCVCRKGFYFPDTSITQKYFNGSTLEEEYEKLMLNETSIYINANSYQCLPCAEGCDACKDSSPCVAALNWPMRTSILVLACTIIGFLPPAAYFTFRYQQVKVLRAASPALLRVIALGAFFIYCTSIVMYPPPSLYTCTARIWLREIGFSLTYGALMLKTWRISVIFRVRSAKAVKITDAALLKRLGILCGCIGGALLVRTIVAPPLVVVGRTADDLKAYLCKTDWWDHTFTSMEVLFLAWGVRLCIMVRKAPSEFNESRFISMAIYNEFLLTCFLNVSMLFLQSPANPDLLYIIFFCHTQLTVTLLLALIFGSKVYLVFRSGGKPTEDTMGLGAKASGAKFICRSQARTMANPSTATSSTAQLGAANADARISETEALEQIRNLCQQLQNLQDRAPPRGVAVATISSLLEGCRTVQSMTLKPPPSITAASHHSKHNSNFLAQNRLDKSTNTNSITTVTGGGILSGSSGGGNAGNSNGRIHFQNYHQQQNGNGITRISITDECEKTPIPNHRQPNHLHIQQQQQPPAPPPPNNQRNSIILGVSHNESTSLVKSGDGSGGSIGGNDGDGNIYSSDSNKINYTQVTTDKSPFLNLELQCMCTCTTISSNAMTTIGDVVSLSGAGGDGGDGGCSGGGSSGDAVVSSSSVCVISENDSFNTDKNDDVINHVKPCEHHINLVKCPNNVNNFNEKCLNCGCYCCRSSCCSCRNHHHHHDHNHHQHHHHHHRHQQQQQQQHHQQKQHQLHHSQQNDNDYCVNNTREQTHGSNCCSGIIGDCDNSEMVGCSSSSGSGSGSCSTCHNKHKFNNPKSVISQHQHCDQQQSQQHMSQTLTDCEQNNKIIFFCEKCVNKHDKTDSKINITANDETVGVGADVMVVEMDGLQNSVVENNDNGAGVDEGGGSSSIDGCGHGKDNEMRIKNTHCEHNKLSECTKRDSQSKKKKSNKQKIKLGNFKSKNNTVSLDSSKSNKCRTDCCGDCYDCRDGGEVNERVEKKQDGDNNIPLEISSKLFDEKSYHRIGTSISDTSIGTEEIPPTPSPTISNTSTSSSSSSSSASSSTERGDRDCLSVGEEKFNRQENKITPSLSPIHHQQQQRHNHPRCSGCGDSGGDGSSNNANNSHSRSRHQNHRSCHHSSENNDNNGATVAMALRSGGAMTDDYDKENDIKLSTDVAPGGDDDDDDVAAIRLGHTPVVDNTEFVTTISNNASSTKIDSSGGGGGGGAGEGVSGNVQEGNIVDEIHSNTNTSINEGSAGGTSSSSSNESSSTTGNGVNTSSSRNKSSETKLVLDLNDRSKYTKEVSV